MLDNLRPAVYLLLALTIESIVAGVFAPVTGNPFVSMGLWFVALVALAVAICWVSWRRAHDIGTADSFGDFLGTCLYALLAVLAMGPFGGLLLSLWGKAEAPDFKDPVLYVGAVSIVLAGGGIWRMYKLLWGESPA